MNVPGHGRPAQAELIFKIPPVPRPEKDGPDLRGRACWRCCPDGFGFLRGPDYNYLAGGRDDNLRVRPLRSGGFDLPHRRDTISGQVPSAPRDSERFISALLKVEAIQLRDSRSRRGDKIFFRSPDFFSRRRRPRGPKLSKKNLVRAACSGSLEVDGLDLGSAKSARSPLGGNGTCPNRVAGAQVEPPGSERATRRCRSGPAGSL